MRQILLTAVNDWFRHRGARLGAALAYYSVFSLGPLLLIVTSVAGLMFGQDAVGGALSGQFRSLLGGEGLINSLCLVGTSGRSDAFVGICEQEVRK